MATGITSKSTISFSLNSLRKTESSLSDAYQKLSSGLRINRAKDDAAGLAIAESLSASIASLGQASRNVSDFSSAVQIADGALSQIQDYTTRLAELATQAANGTNVGNAAISEEYTQITQEIERIVSTTEFNGIKLLEGSSLTAQVGTGSDANSQLTVRTSDLSSLVSTLSSQNLNTAEGARAALDAVSQVSEGLSSQRGTLGAFQSRLESASESISTRRLNETQARSGIVDADIADVVAKKTRDDILNDVNTSLLAQAGRLDKDRIKVLLG